MITATLDTGALVAMERRKARGNMLLRAAREHRAQLFAITPVVAEWWRGRSDIRDRIAIAVNLVPFPASAARVAGEVLARMGEKAGGAKTTVDVMVMAFAATLGGGVVYTSDLTDLSVIGAHFPGVRLLGI